MLWAAAYLCFFRFFRSGEVVVPSENTYDPEVHLSVGDVRADNTVKPLFLEVWIKASKIDIFQKGVSIYLPE